MDERYLYFSLGAEFFGIPIRKVREIIRYTGMTPVHDAVPCVRGVINLRGMIITVFDLRERFGMEHREYNKYTVFIITEIQGPGHDPFLLGLAVDEVHQVVMVPEAGIQQSHDAGLSVHNDYLTGLARSNTDIVQLMDPDRILPDLDGLKPRNAPPANPEAPAARHAPAEATETSAAPRETSS